MGELLDSQVCPFCEHEVEDHLSNWDEDTEYVDCSKCNREYSVSAQYKFLGLK